MTFILVAPFLLFMAVVAMNLFIALLSNTFQNVQDHAHEYALLQQVRKVPSDHINNFHFFQKKKGSLVATPAERHCFCCCLQATLISTYEDKWFCRCCFNFYDKYIRNNCNPLVINRVTFDEDDLNRLQSKVKLIYNSFPFYDKFP